MVAEGDAVVVRVRLSGTHEGVGKRPINGGKLVGVPPTGKRFGSTYSLVQNTVRKDCGALCRSRRYRMMGNWGCCHLRQRRSRTSRPASSDGLSLSTEDRCLAVDPLSRWPCDDSQLLETIGTRAMDRELCATSTHVKRVWSTGQPDCYVPTNVVAYAHN